MAWGDPLDRSDFSTDPIDDPRDGDIASVPPEDLRCPICDYGVFGLPENRCPECGKSFAWPRVRALALRRRSRLFEHRWLDSPPASLLHTWGLAAFRPWRLWDSYDPQDPPRWGPLLILMLLQWLLFAQAWPVLALATNPLMNYLGELTTRSGQTSLRFTYLFRVGPTFLVDLAMWQLATFAALQAFFQSKRRYRVCWKRILRVFVHRDINEHWRRIHGPRNSLAGVSTGSVPRALLHRQRARRVLPRVQSVSPMNLVDLAALTASTRFSARFRAA